VRHLLVFGIQAGSLLVSTSATVVQIAVPPLLYDPAGPVLGCRDFETREQAQAFYLPAGGPDGDPHELDRDRDGIACESLRGAPLRRGR
jgi:hypothetical protein